MDDLQHFPPHILRKAESNVNAKRREALSALMETDAARSFIETILGLSLDFDHPVTPLAEHRELGGPHAAHYDPQRSYEQNLIAVEKTVSGLIGEAAAQLFAAADYAAYYDTLLLCGLQRDGDGADDTSRH